MKQNLVYYRVTRYIIIINNKNYCCFGIFKKNYRDYFFEFVLYLFNQEN